MADMIALELNSVTRIHNEIHSLMVKCQLHIIIQNFVFPCIMSLITNHEFSCLGAMRCISNTVTTYSYVGHSTVHSGTWNSTNNALNSLQNKD